MKKKPKEKKEVKIKFSGYGEGSFETSTGMPMVEINTKEKKEAWVDGLYDIFCDSIRDDKSTYFNTIEFIKKLLQKDRDQNGQEWYRIMEKKLAQQRQEIINDLESNPNEDGSISPNIQHWIEQKQIQLRKKRIIKTKRINH